MPIVAVDEQHGGRTVRRSAAVPRRVAPTPRRGAQIVRHGTGVRRRVAVRRSVAAAGTGKHLRRRRRREGSGELRSAGIFELSAAHASPASRTAFSDPHRSAYNMPARRLYRTAFGKGSGSRNGRHLGEAVGFHVSVPFVRLLGAFVWKDHILAVLHGDCPFWPCVSWCSPSQPDFLKPVIQKSFWQDCCGDFGTRNLTTAHTEIVD